MRMADGETYFGMYNLTETDRYIHFIFVLTVPSSVSRPSARGRPPQRSRPPRVPEEGISGREEAAKPTKLPAIVRPVSAFHSQASRRYLDAKHTWSTWRHAGKVNADFKWSSLTSEDVCENDSPGACGPSKHFNVFSSFFHSHRV